jgi:hypothetical protein
VARATPDGYTVLFAFSSYVVDPTLASASSACCVASHLTRSASHAASQVSKPLALASERRRLGLDLLVGLDPVRVGGEPILRGDTKTLQRAGFVLFTG